MKFFTKDMLNIPSTVFCLMGMLNLFGLINTYWDVISPVTAFVLVWFTLLGLAGVICNAVLAFKVIKLNAIERSMKA